MKMKKQTPADITAECHYEGLKALIRGYGDTIAGFVEDIHRHLNLTGPAGECKFPGAAWCYDPYCSKHNNPFLRRCSIKGCAENAHIQYMGIRYCEKHQPPLDKSIKDACRYPFGKYVTSGDLKNAPGGVLLGKGKAVEFTDFPLHVRVAKALGWDCLKFDIYEWIGRKHDYHAMARCPVPNYPNDLVAAMGALGEYQKGRAWRIDYLARKKDGKWQWLIDFNHNGVSWISADTLPQAICEAIVAHAEEA